MTLTLGSVEFDKVLYDREADVLYLSVEGTDTEHWAESPEGHVLRFDESWALCGMTLIDVRRLLDSEGRLPITIPRREELDSGDLELALA